MTVLYKITGPNGKPVNGGKGRWRLPKKVKGRWKAGAWMPPIKGKLEPCERGYHLCEAKDLLSWLGPVIHVAKRGKEIIDHGDKLVVREARLVRTITTWNDRTARLFAADCAERAIKKFWKDKKDTRPIEAVRAARAYARKPSKANLKAVSEAAAAAREAAWAAWAAAARAAGAAEAAAARAERAAWAAAARAERAAWAAAAEGAARAAAAAERKWQTRRLLKYLNGELK